MRKAFSAVVFAFTCLLATPGVAQQQVTSEPTWTTGSNLFWQPVSGALRPPQAPTPRGTPAPQQLERLGSVWPAFGPITPGVDLGNGLTLLPSITAGAFHDDNVFATNANRRSDWAGVVRPELALRSVGPQHAVLIQGAVERREYDRYDSESQTNAAAGFDSLYMPNPDTQLISRFRYNRGHESRGSGESELFATDRPIAYDTYEAAGALNRRYGHWWTSFGAANQWINYETPTVMGVPIDQSYRNGEILVGSGRVGYVVAPLTSFFVELAGNRRNFKVDDFDSDGYRVVGGFLFEEGPGARLKGEAYAGFMNQDYVGATFQTVSTYTYGGALAFLLTPQWTAVVEGRREAKESALNFGVSVTESYVAGRLDYLIAPNLVFGFGASYLVDEFNGASRTDDTISPLLSLKYFPTPFVTLSVDYRHVDFKTDALALPPVTSFDYRRNVVLFALHAKL